MQKKQSDMIKLMLACLIVLALLFLLVPMIRQKKNRKVIGVIFIPLFALGAILLYYRWGGIDKLHDQEAFFKLSSAIQRLNEPNTSKEMIISTLAKLEVEMGSSALGLAQLGRIYNELGLFDQSIQVYDKVVARKSDEPEYQLQRIYSYSLKNQGKLPAHIRKEAIKLEASRPHEKPLINLLAIDDYFKKDYQEAIIRWERLLLVDNELTAERRKVLENIILKAKDQIHPKQHPKQSEPEVRFRVKVNIDKKLLPAIRDPDTVFIFIKDKTREGPPLAALKRKARELPFVVDLDDQHAMLKKGQLKPGMEVVVIAKISNSGHALENANGNGIHGVSQHFRIKSGVNPVEIVMKGSSFRSAALREKVAQSAG